MDTVLKSYELRNGANNCTILIQNYCGKYSAVPFWRVLFRYDSVGGLFQVRRDGLSSRPNLRRVLAGF